MSSSRQSWLGALPGAKKVYGGNAGKKKQPAAKARAPLRTLQTNALATVDEDAWLAPSRKNACATPEEKAPKPRARTTTTMAARESSALFVDSSSDEEPEAKSKGKGLEGAVAAGADEDVAWLREALGAEGFVSFGKRTVRVPRSWRRSRRSRVIGWCEDLGFRCVATAESTILEMSSRAVGELREKLAARGGGAPEQRIASAALRVVEARAMRFKAPPPPPDDAAPPPPADDDADEAADAFDASARGAPGPRRPGAAATTSCRGARRRAAAGARDARGERDAAPARRRVAPRARVRGRPPLAAACRGASGEPPRRPPRAASPSGGGRDDADLGVRRGGHARGPVPQRGAFKRVFAVSGEAVGVADLALLGGDAGAAAEAAKELEISTRLAQLLDRGCCPNFVAAAFVAAPPAPAWGGAAAKGNRKKKGARWLYARMELCGHGDVEGWLRSLPGGALPDGATLALFFQMCFSLYASRAALGLRHYDVKLLNFLAAPVAAATVARYAVGPAAFDLRLDPALCGAWAKLADFGTSRCDAASLGAHADGSLLTTVENAPADLLVAGDAADFHGFAHDTFSLGLAAVHLFGGCAPYEELMADCTCPAPLRGALAKLWLADGGGGAVARTCRTVYDDDGAGNSGDASSDDDGVGEPYDRTLFDTLYRFFVLLGVPEADALGPAGQRVRKRFADDAARFDLETGDAPAIARCRARFGENLPLLKAMLAFDAAQRPTMRALLLSPLFAPLRATGELRADAVVATFARRDDAAPIPDV
ncbi:hypothetical protein JL721_879 [Aureococcus anophagefferens]|nr:hypothetical protein JL721_879 [Aureococcus anophagefferens]